MKKSKKAVYLTLISIFAILTLLLAGLMFIRQAKSTLYCEKVNYLEEFSYKTAEIIQEQISGYLSTIDAISTFIGGRTTFSAEEYMPILQIEANKKSFKRMGVIYPDGMAITTDGYAYDFSEREYFQRAIKGELCVSDMLIDKVDNDEINVFAAPIYHKNEIVGVVFATKTQEQFSKSLEIMGFNNEAYCYIITSSGESVIKTTHPNGIGEYRNLFDIASMDTILNRDFEKLKDGIKNGENGFIENVKDGSKRQICYTKIWVNDWYILSVIPSEAISAQSDMLMMQLTALMISIVVLAGIVSFFAILGFRKNNKNLEKIAYTDSITGYSNTAKFTMDAKEILGNDDTEHFAIILLNIKKFKVVNDLFGHNTGNMVLKALSEIIDKSIDKGETFARLASDNFCALIRYENEEAIVCRLEELVHKIENIINNYKIEIAAGIYLIREKETSIDVLNDRARIACDIAKKQNDTFYCFFKEENRLDIIREKEIENVMDAAMANDEFEVYLQPKYLLNTEHIVGAEALVRWNSQDKGIIFPNEFIPLFEKNGFIRKLDLYMFRQVCALIAKWEKNPETIQTVSISVNISRVHLSDWGLPQKLLSIAKEYGVAPGLIEIELTENAVYLDVDGMIKMMKEIKDLGFLISIDDFGSGYSSLSTLKDLPADFIKIDKSFLDKSSTDKRGEEIIKSIVTITQVLGMLTVAEGVETQQQVSFLKSVGCDIAQGYFYSKPRPIAEFEQLIRKKA